LVGPDGYYPYEKLLLARVILDLDRVSIDTRNERRIACGYRHAATSGAVCTFRAKGQEYLWQQWDRMQFVLKAENRLCRKSVEPFSAGRRIIGQRLSVRPTRANRDGRCGSAQLSSELHAPAHNPKAPIATA
jgi:hypothetical protein